MNEGLDEFIEAYLKHSNEEVRVGMLGLSKTHF